MKRRAFHDLKMPAPATTKPDQARALEEIEAAEVDPAFDTVEEFQATSLDQHGQSRDSTGRRARRHGVKEQADRETVDLPDEPPPGWPGGYE